METTGMTSYKALPPPAKRYLARMEELAACPMDIISTGSKRNQTIVVRHPMASAHRKSARPRRVR